MLEKNDQILELCIKYFRGDLTPEEKVAFEGWLAEDERHRRLHVEFTDDNLMEEKMRAFAYSQRDDQDGWRKVKHYMNTGYLPDHQSRVRPISKYALLAAATVAVVIIVWYIIDTNNDIRNNEGARDDFSRNAQGLSNHHGELILENGKKILLHKTANGLINTVGAFKVYKNDNDLYYKNAASGPFKKEMSNTISTFNGSQYRIILPDGSTITMNVASSVELGVSSLGAIRKVKLKGEALFAVAPDSANPFNVTIPSAGENGSNGKVEVIGTRFNVNAYQGEAEKAVTLLEGNLNVYTIPAGMTEPMTISHAGYYTKLLNKGEQAQWRHDGSILVHRNVDTAEAVGWRSGIVTFNRTPTRKVLNTLEKWYDVKVEYTTQKIPEFRFTGKITPGMKITTVLDIMHFQCDSLHFNFDSAMKKVIVLP
jgi:transmembrane sensor